MAKIDTTLIQPEWDKDKLPENKRTVDELRQSLVDSNAELNKKNGTEIRRLRYFMHLAKEASSDEKSHRNCAICRNDFERGVLTECGHLACKILRDPYI